MNKAVSIESLHRVQDARHLSNPTRNGRSECRVGVRQVRTAVCRRHTTITSEGHPPLLYM